MFVENFQNSWIIIFEIFHRRVKILLKKKKNRKTNRLKCMSTRQNLLLNYYRGHNDRNTPSRKNCIIK